MNKFIQSMRRMTVTENGAATFRGSGSAVLDFFSRAGAMRGQFAQALALFDEALQEDPLLAMKALFWLRDVRGGAGERDLFRYIVAELARSRPALVLLNLELFPKYGRWDDLLPLLNFQEFVSPICEIFKAQIQQDLLTIINDGRVSLLGKWLPSENASSKKSRGYAKIICAQMGYLHREYRQILSILRQAIGVVERRMSSGGWENIAYGDVPSRAAMIYRRAFVRHDADRYGSYLEGVKGGSAKINAGALYPYDLVHRAINEGGDPTIDALWDALPDYLAGNPHNGIVVCDTSGSMEGQPIEVAISLALYTAERNRGVFQGHFITFSEEPELQEIRGETLREKVENLSRAKWGYNTNLRSVFELILRNGKRFNISPAEMPEVVYIVTDMEFDECVPKGTTNFEGMESMYMDSGYTLPSVVFWDVEAHTSQSPVRYSQKGVSLVSGFSPTIFTTLLSDGVEGLRNMTPLTLMLKKLNDQRYEGVRI